MKVGTGVLLKVCQHLPVETLRETSMKLCCNPFLVSDLGVRLLWVFAMPPIFHPSQHKMPHGVGWTQSI